MRKLSVPLAVAFLSGMAALVYEIVWMRVFTPIFGLSIYSTAAVLCAFMGGLGLGSVLAPRIIASWRRSLWALYALLEVGIAVGALLIPYTVEPITRAYVATAGLEATGPMTGTVRFGLSFLVMLFPTFFMGLTLPVLIHACRSLVAEDPVTSRRAGTLYGVNTVGAATGCLLVGFFLLHQLGIRGTIYAMVAVNFSLAAIVSVLYWRRTSPAAPAPAPSAPIDVADESPADPGASYFPAGLVLLLYGIVGFTSFGYELAWFRLLVFYLQSATYSFSIMLTVFLVGLGLGSLFYSQIVERRIRRGDSIGLAAKLASIQVLLALCGVITVPLFMILHGVWYVLIQVTGADSWYIISFQKLCVAAVLVFPPTFLMGIAFPLFVRLHKDRQRPDSTSVGLLYGANTAGAIAGSLVTAFVLFDTLGVQRTLVFLAACNLLVGAILGVPALRRSTRPRVVFAGFALVVIAIAVFTPSRILVERYAKKAGGEIVYYSESASDIMYVVERTDGHRQLHFNDGRGTSATIWEPNYVNRLLAYSTMVMNPDAKDVLVISMGCGNTAAAYTKFDIDRLDIVDISAGPFEAAGYFFTNDGVMHDPRVHTHVEDGRNFLLKCKQQYDVIQIELPSIHADGVVTLYTREFYELARDRLRDGGVLSQWVDASQARRELSYTLINTMRDVFPGSIVWADKWAWWVNGVKGNPAPVVDFASAHAAFQAPRVAADAAAVRSSFEDLLAKVVCSGEILHETVSSSPIATDDRTIVDFEIPRLTAPRAMGGGVAHMGSPMRAIFARYWQAAGSDLSGVSPYLPFYEGDRHDELVDASLVAVAKGFPEPVLARILTTNGRWEE